MRWLSLLQDGPSVKTYFKSTLIRWRVYTQKLHVWKVNDDTESFEASNDIILFVNGCSPSKHLEVRANNKLAMFAECRFLEDKEVVKVNCHTEFLADTLLFSRLQMQGRTHGQKYKNRREAHIVRTALHTYDQGWRHMCKNRSLCHYWVEMLVCCV